MMKADQAVRQIVQGLPAGVQARLARVSVQLKPEPDAEDLARGATVDHRGYFYGKPHEFVETTELPDEEPPEGFIVLFTAKIKPYTLAELARTLLHEIGHVLGYSEEQLVNEMGL
jgi:predicted Zn-dependent protease with MMP-like domain